MQPTNGYVLSLSVDEKQKELVLTKHDGSKVAVSLRDAINFVVRNGHATA